MRLRICAGRGLVMEHPVMAACWVPQVYRGLLNHVQPVAVKVIPAGIVGSAPRASVETIREITLLRQCRCPHIVQAWCECLVPAQLVDIAAGTPARALLQWCARAPRLNSVWSIMASHSCASRAASPCNRASPALPLSHVHAVPSWRAGPERGGAACSSWAHA